MIRRTRSLLATLALAGAAAAILAAPALGATAAPAWRVESHAAPTHLVPGLDTGQDMYVVNAINTGGANTDGSTVTITDNLPAGFTAQATPTFTCSSSSGSFTDCYLVFGIESDQDAGPQQNCVVGPPVVCTLDHTFVSGERLTVFIPVSAPASGPATVTNQVTVTGGGAAPASTSEVTPFSADPAPFGIQHMETSLTDVDGSSVTQAGAHPASFRIGFAANAAIDENGDRGLAGNILSSEPVKDVTTHLPPGLIVNPTATPRCTEAQFESSTFGNLTRAHSACPDESTVGVAQTTVTTFGFPTTGAQTFPLYNIAPPNKPAEFGFQPFGLGIYVHVDGSLDPAHGYALRADSHSLTEYGGFLGVVVDLWGDPSAPAYDLIRGGCADFTYYGDEACPVAPNPVPLLSMPSSCSDSLSASFAITSWAGSSATAGAEVKDGADPPVATPVTGCDALNYTDPSTTPTLTARPTTNVADSPSGLDVDLQIPQSESQNTLATSTLRKAVVTLPEGLTLNPAAANGLAACSSSQIGIDPNTATPNGAQPSCPDASKLGTAQVTTPLLDNPLPGAIYLAKPGDNPFHSQLAIYLVIDDPQTGVLVKLAGKVVADPDSGRLTTTFDNNPQLPFSDFKLSFFGGATGALRTPDVCGDYSTTSSLSPYSGTADAHPHDDYSISQGPNGSCPSSPAEQPNSPSFDAGSVSPNAGAYSPFVLNLKRDDATQQFSKITLSPPPGLVAKLAGTPACPEAGIAQAQGRTASGDGALEQGAPSCPAASKVGVVHVGAGAGPEPYYVSGNVYLAGPYKGAPLSLVIITPAVAGPFDLGVVTTRVAIAIDPITAQITTTADPVPDHLTVDGNGFPLDVRSVQLALDKPDFTLNGTSCDPSSLSGSLLSTLGQSAALSEPFQLAECTNLGFKPKLGMRLRGGHFRNGHPALTTVLSARGGDADIAKAQVILPPSMQLDQSHIQAPCTRPQFAADQCPPAAVIGTVTATSPLLDYKLAGPVYLRTGDNPLPDVVLDLHGPASQPIRITQVGKIDTVHARLRTTFTGIPDAPISKAIIRLLGGHKGLLVNNTNLCKQPNRASVFLDGHNNKVADSTSRLALRCPKAHKHRKKHRRHKRHRLRNNRAVR